MRFLLLPLLALLTVSSALECYVGWVPSNWDGTTTVDAYGKQVIIPKLTQCKEDAKCCEMTNGFFPRDFGKNFDCGSRCPDFMGKSELVDELVQDAYIVKCQRAEGSCKFNQTKYSH